MIRALLGESREELRGREAEMADVPRVRPGRVRRVHGWCRRPVRPGTGDLMPRFMLDTDTCFFGSLKKELIKKQIYKSRDVATAAIADYIETFYNRSRRHSHLGGISPEQFETADLHREAPRGGRGPGHAQSGPGRGRRVPRDHVPRGVAADRRAGDQHVDVAVVDRDVADRWASPAGERGYGKAEVRLLPRRAVAILNLRDERPAIRGRPRRNRNHGRSGAAHASARDRTSR